MTRGGTEVEPTRRVDLNDLAGRVTIVVLFSLMTVRFAAYAVASGRVTGLFLIASELLVVVLTIIRRPATEVDRAWSARFVTVVSVVGPLLLRPGSSAAVVPDWASGALGAGGLLLIVSGKVCLGRSFGLMPANRGIVAAGLYRFVRHPIYLGYLMTHIAIVAAFPGAPNLVIFAVSDAALISRAIREERTLTHDPLYAAYARRVPWRLIPGLF